MNVKLTAITQPTDAHLSPEDLIIYCARVSNPENQSKRETYPKLMDFLIKSGHWSPFEMVSMSVEIETSRAIAQQILRHRSFSFQEFSQRYSAVTEMEPVELRYQADKNRQSSTDICGDFGINSAVQQYIHRGQALYAHLLERGIAKESARFILPLTAQTTMYMHGTVRSWIHYLAKRADAHAQKEHQQIGWAIRDIFCESFPTIAEALWGGE